MEMLLLFSVVNKRYCSGVPLTNKHYTGAAVFEHTHLLESAKREAFCGNLGNLKYPK
jgi:hypothetical protein